MLVSDGGVGVEDAAGEVCVGLDLGVGPEEAIGEACAGADLAVRTNPAVRDGGGGIDLGGFVDLGDVVSGFERGTDAVGFEIGLAGTEVEPVALISVEGSEFFLGS